MKLILIVHAVATFFMVGAIWLVQVVHYNLFNQVGREAFTNYQNAHIALIAPVVGIPMLIEAMTAFLLFLEPPANVPRLLPLLGLGLVGVVWWSTLFLQIPQHNILANGFNAQAYEALVGSNWVRTLAWTVRGGLVAWMLLEALGQA